MKKARLEAIEELIRDRYRSQAAAAAAWGMNDSTLSRILRGERSPDRWLRTIAKKEGLTQEHLHSPALILARSSDPAKRFRFSVSDPEQMLAQLDEWFTDLPTEGPTRQRVVRAVMRVLLDESFQAGVHRPPDSWRFVMNRLEGLLLPTSNRDEALGQVKGGKS